MPRDATKLVTDHLDELLEGGIFLSSLQMADSSAVTRRSSAFLSTTLSVSSSPPT